MPLKAKVSTTYWELGCSARTQNRPGDGTNSVATVESHCTENGENNMSWMSSWSLISSDVCMHYDDRTGPFGHYCERSAQVSKGKLTNDQTVLSTS